MEGKVVFYTAITAALVVLVVLVGFVAGGLFVYYFNKPVTSAMAPDPPAASEPAPPIAPASLAAENQGCEPESMEITPQGLMLEDGSFLWQDLGEVGTWLAADGELWRDRDGEAKNDGVTDYVLFKGGSVTLRMWQGTLYQYCESIGYEDALAIVEGRNIPDKFTTTPVHQARIWRVVDGEPVLVKTISRDSSTSVEPAATASWPASLDGAAEMLDVPRDRLAYCEDSSDCISLIEGDPILIKVPAGMTYEGWDSINAQTVPVTEGPAEVTLAGATLRPS